MYSHAFDKEILPKMLGFLDSSITEMNILYSQIKEVHLHVQS